jgi:RNA polymerase sigma-70 factor (ECF subfamily)
MQNSSPACEVSCLVEQYYDRLYRYAYRLSGSHCEAEDLTQQTFLAAQSCLEQLRDATRVRGWLFTILRNFYLKSLRDQPEQGVASLDVSAEPADAPAEDVLVDSAELQTALQELPEEYRTPIVLFYFQEFSYKDIADQMGVPIGTVMSRLSRGKTWLRRRLTPTLVEGQ